MSHEMSTVLVSCGLMVGLNIAPPPPGPITRKLPGRSPQAVVNKIAKAKPATTTFNFMDNLMDASKESDRPCVSRSHRAVAFANSLVPPG